jgi:hypothetical protein
MELDLKRLAQEFKEVAEALESCANVKLPPDDPEELGERYRLEFKTLKNQIEALSKNCEYVYYESEYAKYRHEMDRRMKLITQYANSNRAVMEHNADKNIGTAKGGITRSITNTQKVLDLTDEWKEANLERAMLSNRKNHTSLELTGLRTHKRVYPKAPIPKSAYTQKHYIKQVLG